MASHEHDAEDCNGKIKSGITCLNYMRQSLCFNKFATILMLWLFLAHPKFFVAKSKMWGMLTNSLLGKT
jgi:hypothetical protein